MKELQFYPLALLGNFQRYGVLRLGKFPNKLWYFLAEIPPCVIGMPIEPACGLCSLHSLYPLCSLYRVCRTSRTAVAISMLAQPKLSIYYFSFRSVGGGAVVSVFKGFFARGGRMQGLGEEYYPKHEGGDCSPNGVAARPCSRRKAPCLLRLCKRE